MTAAKKERLKNKIIESRTRLTQEQPFCAVLLMYLRYVIDDNIKKVSTNGRCIFFSPAFLDKLYPTELDFVLCHIAFHIALEHIWRPVDIKSETYHHACNIIINSLLYECGYTQKRFPHLGTIHRKVYPYTTAHECSVETILSALPCRLEIFDEKTRVQYFFDSDEWWDVRHYTGRRHEVILYATDEPFEYITPEYQQESINEKSDGQDGANDDNNRKGNGKGKAKPKKSKELSDEGLRDAWKTRVKTAEKMTELLDGEEGFGVGNLPECTELTVGNKPKAVTDWKSILEAFIQEQTCDYSFMPPDKRFGDSDIFLPDFNEKEMVIKNVLFMVDTSGSFDADMIGRAFSEIEWAIEQFGGLLSGKVGFFDAAVQTVTEFSSAAKLKRIKPVGGGGTDFCPISDYIQDELQNSISSLAILTDGSGKFPESIETLPYPVLWLINNEEVTPPFGKVARVPTYELSECEIPEYEDDRW